MNVRHLIIVILTVSFGSASGQVEKGQWSLSGQLHIENNIFNISNLSPMNRSVIRFSPGVEYFMDSSSSAGLETFIAYNSIETGPLDHQVSYGLKPFLRSYKELNPDLYLFGMSSLEFSYIENVSSEKEVTYSSFSGGIYFSPGLILLLNKDIGLEGKFGNVGLSLNSNSNDTSDFNFILALNNLSLGLRLFL